MGFLFFVWRNYMKRMYSFIAIILIFLGFAYFQESKPAIQKNKVPEIGVLTLMHHPALDEIYRGFLNELKAEGYQNGKNIKINYQNANGDQSNLRTMASKLVDQNNDILVGITTPAAQALANDTKTTPIILGGITDPQGAGLVKSNNHPGSNITGVSDGAPIEQQLHLIKEFMPNLKTLGVIYTSSDNSAVSEYKKVVAECKKMHINLKRHKLL